MCGLFSVVMDTPSRELVKIVGT